MHPIITPKPKLARKLSASQCLGQAAGLVELDVDHVIAAGQCRQRGAVMTAFIGADRHRMRNFAQDCVLSGRQWLFDQADTQLGGDQKISRMLLSVPAFIGVENDLGVGARTRHRLHTGSVVGGPDLDLEQGCRQVRARPRRPCRPAHPARW